MLPVGLLGLVEVRDGVGVDRVGGEAMGAPSLELRHRREVKEPEPRGEPPEVELLGLEDERALVLLGARLLHVRGCKVTALFDIVSLRTARKCIGILVNCTQ